MTDAKIAIRSSLSRFVTQVFRNFQVTFMVVYGCFKISQTLMGHDKIAVRCCFSQSVTQGFRNFQTTVKVLYGCFEIS